MNREGKDDYIYIDWFGKRSSKFFIKRAVKLCHHQFSRTKNYDKDLITLYISIYMRAKLVLFFFFLIKEKYCESVCKICDNLHRFKIDENDVAKTSKQKKKKSKKKKKRRSNTSI